MKIVATIEARMSSTRLPGKVMKPILGKPVLELLIERLKRVNLIDDIVVATTNNKEDNIIENLCKKIKIKCFRGSEKDVLERVLLAAKSVNADLIVEITGDCPLIDPYITKECIKLFLKGNYDYISNGYKEKTFPDGLAVQIVPVKILDEVNTCTTDPVDHEHVCYYIYSHPQKYRLQNYRARGELYWPELAITLDTPNDYKLIKIIFEKLYPQNPRFSAYDVVRFLRINPELVTINDDPLRRNNYFMSRPRSIDNGKYYRAVIIGAGRIGAFYSSPKDKTGITTHAHAYKQEKRIKLVGFVDIDKQKVQKAARIWGGKAYTNIDEMFKKENPDIVSICTPDKIHEKILKTCLKYKPRLVFCEKPLTTDVKSAEYFIKAYNEAHIVLAVNYLRRWNQSIINLKKKIEKNQFGQPLNIIGIYNKGILHNGSHLIDLLRYLFGEIAQAIPLSARIDWQKTDPTMDAFLKFSNGSVAHIVAADCRQYEIFELDLLFIKGRICFCKSGNEIKYYQVVDDKQTKGYKQLFFMHRENTNLKSTLLKAIPNLINYLEKKENLFCSGTDALATQKICQGLIEKYRRRQ